MAKRLLLATALLAASFAHAEPPPLRLDRDTPPLVVTEREFLVDPTGEATLEEVRARPAEWKLDAPASPAPRYVPGALWFRFRIRNAEPERNRWSISYILPSAPTVDFHLAAPGKPPLSVRSGARLVGETAVIAAQAPYFRFDLDAGAEAEAYVRVKSDWLMKAEIVLRPGSERAQLARIIQSYFAFMLGIFLLNALIYASSRSRVGMLYLLLQSALVFHFLNSTGVINFLGVYPGRWSWLAAPSNSFVMAAAILFATHFLELPRQYPRAHRLLQALFWALIAITAALLAMGTRVWLLDLIDLMLLAHAPILLAVSGHGMLRGSKLSAYYFVSMVFLIAGTAAWVMTRHLSATETYWTHFAPFFGSAMEALILAFAAHEALQSSRLLLVRKLEERTSSLETELDHQKAAAMYASRMSALGEMAGGIAHEINNPLTVIQGLATQLRRLVASGNPEPAQLDSRLEKIDRSVVRISKIIKGLRTFSRDAAHDPFMATGARRIVEETLELCRSELEHQGIALHTDLPDASLSLDCREVQVSQILMNLLSNARDAIVSRPERWIRVAVTDSGADVEFRVTDSGPGIPEAVRVKLMQPFFTTKEVGKGVGLGLSISKGIAESHGGALTCRTEGGHTCFVLSLPRKHAYAEA